MQLVSLCAILGRLPHLIPAHALSSLFDSKQILYIMSLLYIGDSAQVVLKTRQGKREGVSERETHSFKAISLYTISQFICSPFSLM